MSYVAFTEEQFNALDDFLTELAQGGGQSTLVPKTVTENGTYDPSDDDADGYSEVTVAVPIPVSTVEPLSVTENGTYNPPTGVDGYAPVTVNVSGGGGGTSADPKDVNFIDYDGTIVYSYTKAEFLALTAMPENPTHEGFVSQGWNWSLADAQEYVGKYGTQTIGQMYITESGDTEIDIVLHKGRLSPYLGLAPNGTVTIDWGDGSTDTVSGTSLTTKIQTKHNYAAPRKYTIRLHVTRGEVAFSNTYDQPILNNNRGGAAFNVMYADAVRAVRIGSGFVFGNDALSYLINLSYVTIPSQIAAISSYPFRYSYNLNSMTLPSGITEIPESAFTGCYCLTSVSVPSTVVDVSSSAFNSCYGLPHLNLADGTEHILANSMQQCRGLTSIDIPSGTTEIEVSAFYYCVGLAEIHFKPTTQPTVANSNAFASIPTDCTIYVPQGSLSAYTSASNYPDPNTYTYVEE